MKVVLKKEIEKKELLENKLNSAYKQITSLKNPSRPLISSVSKERQLRIRNSILLTGGPARLTSDIVLVSEERISEGTFGSVNVGNMRNLDVKCAIKSGKTLHLFDANHEANVLQRLQGSRFFPFLFGVLDKSLVMEYIGFVEGTKTIYMVFVTLSKPI